MDRQRRRGLLELAADVVRGNDVERWLRRQMADLEEISG
jgi:hypothetical protein